MKATIISLWLLILPIVVPGLLLSKELSKAALEYIQEKGENIFVSQTS